MIHYHPPDDKKNLGEKNGFHHDDIAPCMIADDAIVDLAPSPSVHIDRHVRSVVTTSSPPRPILGHIPDAYASMKTANVPAERAILGAMLTDPSIIDGVIEAVCHADYHTYAHRIIHTAIAQLHEQGITPDIVSVATHLTPDQMIDIGGHGYLADLLDAVPSTGDWQHYAGILRQHAQRRDLLKLAREITVRATDAAVHPTDIIQAVETTLRNVDSTSSANGWWQPVSTTDLVRTVRKPQWLVQRMLVDGQPAIVGAPRKCLKTTIAIDLAISMASAASFLGAFSTYAKRRVAIVSGESGEWTILETAKRIAGAKGIDIPDGIIWNFTLPRLSDPTDLSALRRAIRANGIEVIIIDPLYLCLLAGENADASAASNLYTMGPLLASIAQACLPDCTPILLHHTRKNITKPHVPLELEDLAFSGIQEFARQWVLINRMAPYKPGTGRHELWLSAGGSCGQSGLWALEIEEGQVGDDFDGRGWQVNVTSAHDAIVQRRDDKADRRYDAMALKRKAQDADVMMTLDKHDPTGQGIGYTRLRELSPLSKDAYAAAVTRLIAEGIIEDVPDYHATIGSGAIRAARGIRRRSLAASEPSASLMEI